MTPPETLLPEYQYSIKFKDYGNANIHTMNLCICASSEDDFLLMATRIREDIEKKYLVISIDAKQSLERMPLDIKPIPIRIDMNKVRDEIEKSEKYVKDFSTKESLLSRWEECGYPFQIKRLHTFISENCQDYLDSTPKESIQDTVTGAISAFKNLLVKIEILESRDGRKHSE